MPGGPRLLVLCALLGAACGPASPSTVAQEPAPAIAQAAAPAIAPATASAPQSPSVAEPAPGAVDAAVAPSLAGTAGDFAVAPPLAGGPGEAAIDPSLAGAADDALAGDLEALRRLLGGGDPEVVEVVELHPVGREALVLLRWYGARAFWSRERAAGRLAATQEQIDAKIDACEAAAGIESVCLEGSIADPYVAWKAAGHELFAWEVARVRGGTVLARVRLYDLSGPATDVPHKFKLYDIDGDTRSELTVIVPVEVPDHYEGLEEEGGEVGFIFEAADLRPQFSATRRHFTHWSDVDTRDTEAETVWLARDSDGDGHADLQVRETVRERGSGGEADSRVEPPRTSTRKTVCPYEPAADLWRCPEALGQQLLARPRAAG